MCEDTSQWYTTNELLIAFNKVKNPGDWKARIFARVPKSDMFLTEAAIRHYTGVTPTVTVYPKYAVVECCGYRLGPAGDY